MKKILSIIALLFIISCGTDNDNGITINTANIIGRWYTKGQTVNGATFQDHINGCPENKDYLDILETNNAATVWFNSNCIMIKNQQATWTLSGTIFTIIYSDPVFANEVYTVKAVSEHELLLEKTYTQEGQNFTVLTNLYRD